MNSLHKSFEDTRSIKVLVIPIGENSLFDTHFDIISKFHCLPIYELNRPSNWKSTNKVFKYFDWNNSGNSSLTFDYLRYDRVSNAPGDLDNFQCTRRVLMVIGLINYPELGRSVDKIEEELDYFSRRHPYVVLRRIFVFNYTFDQVSPPLPNTLKGPADDNNSLVVLAPDGECEGGNMVEVHLREVMGYAAIKIFSALEKQTGVIDECLLKNKYPTTLKLSTFHDDIDDGQDKEGKAKKMAAIKKKPSGRMHKWKGDFSLQVCSPLDALEHYSQSIVECRALGDTLWIAGALEGYLTTVLVLLSLGEPIEEYIGKDVRILLSKISTEQIPQNTNVCTTANIFSLVEDRAKEAISIYSKSIHYSTLEVECTLRLARMFEASTSIERDQKVLDYVFHAAAVPGLNIQHQIECTIEGALICYRLGMKRKYGFLLYLAALMCVESDNISSAHALIRNACSQYGLNARSPTKHHNILNTQDTKDLKCSIDSEDIEMVDPAASWVSMRKALFAHSAYIAKECGDTLSAARFTAALLRLMRDDGKRNQMLYNHSENEADYFYEAIDYVDSVSVTESAGKSKRAGAYEMTSEQSDDFFTRNSVTVRRSSFSSVASSAASVFQPPSIIMLNQKPAETQQPQKSSNSFASLITSTSDSFMFSLRNSSSEESGGFGDITIAANKLKEGFKRITVPKVTPEFLKVLRKNEQKLRRRRLKSKATDVYTHIEYSTPTKSPLPTGTRISDMSRHSDTGITEEIDALDRSLSLQQEQAITMLEKWTSELPPSSFLHLPVSLIQIMIRQLPEGQQPFKLTDANSKFQDKLLKKTSIIANRILQLESGDNSEENENIDQSNHRVEEPERSPALFYDPFAAKRQKELSDANVEVFWVKDIVCTCIAIVENPLDVDIRLDNVRLLAEGVRHTSFSRTINIPARVCNYAIELTIKPTELGTLKIVGIEIALNNSLHKLLIDEVGFCIARRPEIAAAYQYPYKANDTKRKKSNENNDNGFISKNLIESSNVTIVAPSPYISLAPKWQSNYTCASDAVNLEIGQGETRKIEMVASKHNIEVITDGINEIEDIRVIVYEYINDIKKSYIVRDFSSSTFRNESSSLESLAQTGSLKLIERKSIVDSFNKSESFPLEFEINYLEGLKKYIINFEIIPKDLILRNIADDVSLKSLEELRSFKLVSSTICCRKISYNILINSNSGIVMESLVNINNEDVKYGSDINRISSILSKTSSYNISNEKIESRNLNHCISFISPTCQTMVRFKNSLEMDVIISSKNTINIIKPNLSNNFIIDNNCEEDTFPLILHANSTRTVVLKSSSNINSDTFKDLHWISSSALSLSSSLSSSCEESRYGKVINDHKLIANNQKLDINDLTKHSQLFHNCNLNIILRGFDKQSNCICYATIGKYYELNIDISLNLKSFISDIDIKSLKYEEQNIEIAIITLSKYQFEEYYDNSVLYTGQICTSFQKNFIRDDDDNNLSLSISHHLGICFTQCSNYSIYILVHDKKSKITKTNEKKIWYTTLPYTIKCKD